MVIDFYNVVGRYAIALGILDKEIEKLQLTELGRIKFIRRLAMLHKAIEKVTEEKIREKLRRMRDGRKA